MYVGRLAIQKKVERLIEAISLLKFPAKLIIVGDGEDRLKLELLTEKLKLKNVTFVGKKYGEELREYYQHADVFAISSDKEGMPLVVLEAMASGLPIVGSNVLGIRELVKGTGILVDKPDGEGFAKAITRIYENPQLIQKLSLKSQKKARQYSWKLVANQFIEQYESLNQI